MKKLKSIEPFSLAKVLAVIDGATGLLVAAAIVLTKNVPAMYQIMSPSTLSVGAWMLVAIPLFAAVAGFLKGFIGAYVYNYVASKIGPVKVDIV